MRYADLKKDLKRDIKSIYSIVDKAKRNTYLVSDSALKASSKLLKLSSELESNFIKAWGLYLAGWYYIDVSEYEKSSIYLLDALELFKEVDDKKGYVFTANELIANYIILGMYGQAHELETKALIIAKEIGEKNHEIYIHLNLCKLYKLTNNYLDAEAMFEQISIAHSWGSDVANHLLFLLEWSEIKVLIGDLSSANHFLSEANKLIVRKELAHFKCLYHLRHAQYLGNIDKLSEAAFAFENAISEADVTAEEIRSVSHYHLAKLAAMNNQEKAIMHYKQAIEYAENIKFTTLATKFKLELSEYYSEHGLSIESYQLMREAYNDRESQYNTHNTLSLHQIKSDQLEYRSKLYADMYNQIETISEMGRQLTACLTLEKIYPLVLDITGILFKRDIISVAVYESDRCALVYSAFDSNGELISEGSCDLESQTSLAAHSLREKKILLLSNVSKEYADYTRDYKIHRKNETGNDVLTELKSFMYLPLVLNNERIGVLSIESYQLNAFKNEDLHKAKLLADYIAIALNNCVMHEKIQYASTHDPLTNVLNRREIMRRVEAKGFYSILMLDIDNFKIINDRFGHMMGDQVIQYVCNNVKDVLRNNDLIGRFGGEEFIVILHETNIEEAMIVANRICEIFTNGTFEIDATHSIKPTVSIGISSANIAIDFAESLKRADEALYMAKNEGKNCYRVKPVDKDSK